MGKLNVYRNADPEELAGLHPSDRLMVQLLKIDRLAPRIEGMLYKCVFDETWGLLDEVSGHISVWQFIVKHLYVERAQAVGSREVVAGSEALQGAP